MVSGGGDSHPVTPSPERIGVCVVRAWVSGGVVVFRVRSRSDVEDPGSEEVVVVVDVEDAAGRVGDFLRALAHDLNQPIPNGQASE